MRAPLPGRVARGRVGRALGIAIATVAVLAAACSRPSSPSAPTSRSVLEFAEVVSANAPGATKLPHYDASLPDVFVADIRRYSVESAKRRPDSQGRTAVEFKLSKDDAAAFSAWTAARLRRGMAVILDGKVMLSATIQEELPGGGFIEFGEPGITEYEADQIAERLAPPK